ncbi:MAG: hypothetical protein M3N98_11585, partial [Actinomycetota bacterium]|nr:hypothetical protein [Actinomycetota bacterium]
SKAIYEQNIGATVQAITGDAVVVADGFSCRTQIAECGNIQALHSAEFLALALTEQAGAEARR